MLELKTGLKGQKELVSAVRTCEVDRLEEVGIDR